MSTLKCDSLQNSAGTKTVPMNTVVDGSAKAWVRFNGTGTVAINASFNVTSITDNGVGNYTVNFTTPFADINYVASGAAGAATAVGVYFTGYAPAAPTTGNFTFYAIQGNNSTAVDVPYISAVFFR